MLALALAASVAAAAPAALPADQQPNPCASCEAWNAPQEPFRIHGDSWYVGTRGLSAVLVDSGEGLVLLDGGLPQSAAAIAANIEALGFSLDEVEWILNSHAHFDHAGGIAALQRMSGAMVAAGPAGAAALARGELPADDPQHGTPHSQFAPVANVRALADGERIALGGVALTRHATPGHTPGGSSWSWRSCEDGECVTLVYADSLSPVSAGEFRFSERAAAPAHGGPAHRDAGTTADALRASIERIRRIDCEVLVSTHPDASGVFDRRAERSESPDANPFVRQGACRTYAGTSAAWLDRRLAEEAQASPAP